MPHSPIRILGVDPGLSATGWGVIEATGSRLSFRACGTIVSGTDMSLSRRLALIHRELADLKEQRLVLREQGSATRQIFETAMARRGLSRGEVLDMNSREAVRETVAAGLGVGVVSAGEFSKDSRLAILELTGADMAMTEYIVCLAERQDLRLVRSFLDLVR